MTKEKRAELRELAGKSTRVVAWYGHEKEVRGPFYRWFECSKVDPKYEHHVASQRDDCAFAAASMNNLVALLDEIDRLEALVPTEPQRED